MIKIRSTPVLYSHQKLGKNFLKQVFRFEAYFPNNTNNEKKTLLLKIPTENNYIVTWPLGK